MSKPSRYTPRRARIPAAVCAVILLACGSASAGEPLQLTKASFMEIDKLVAAAKGRPNEEQRLRGLKSWKSGRYPEAVSAFKIAAYHADKHSQHYLSLIFWHGAGVPADRVQAYIWSDLAGERGIKPLLVIREKMWSQLTLAEQAQVQEEGEAYYAKYGDGVAQPRTEASIRHFRNAMTGSRLGHRGQKLEIAGKPEGGSFDVCPSEDTGTNNVVTVSAAELYSGLDEIELYWKQQDMLMRKLPMVEVGPLSQLL